MKKQWIVLSAIVVLALLAIYQTSTPNNFNEEELPKVGYKAPSFSLTGLDGKEYSLEDLNGKPVVINFWASWCPPCRVEAPELVRLYEKYSEQLEIYAVNVTTGDNVDDAKEFAEEYGFKFPVLLDPEGIVSGLYQIRPIPVTFFVNGNGMIVDQVLGLVDSRDLERKFKRLFR